jgi:hypothetical protein
MGCFLLIKLMDNKLVDNKLVDNLIVPNDDIVKYKSFYFLSNKKLVLVDKQSINLIIILNLMI